MISIVSSPKSGRTWLKFILGKYHALHNGLDDDQILSSALNGYQFSHDIGGLDSNKVKTVNTDNSIVFLKRNVYDVVVSSYYHANYREEWFSGNISEFIQSDFYPVQKWKNMCDKWEPLADVIITYEELHKNPFNTVCSVLECWNKPIRGDLLLKAIDYSSFDNMKKIETAGTFSNTEAMKSTKHNLGMKVRSGKTNNYNSTLSKDDVNLIDKLLDN